MSLVIAAAQSSSVPGNVSQNVEHHLRFVRLAAQHGVHLLVFPELSLTGYELAIANDHALSTDSPELDSLRSSAIHCRMTVAAGAPMRSERGDLHIAAFILKPDGSTSVYAKQHVHESEQHVFVSGPGGSLVNIQDTAIALAICADATHPQHAAHAAECGANVYAVGAMIDEAGYQRKSALLKNYAETHGIAVLLANYSGVTGGDQSAGRSCIRAEDGRVVAESSGAEEALIVGTKSEGKWTGVVSPLKRAVSGRATAS